MFDAQCDLAALVYDDGEYPDAVLSDFAADLNAHGVRAVGMVQAGQCADSSLSAVLVHSGETILLAQDFDPRALNADIPVVIAVSSHRFADWVRFAGGMSVKLRCDRATLEAWWNGVSSSQARAVPRSPATICEVLFEVGFLAAGLLLERRTTTRTATEIDLAGASRRTGARVVGRGVGPAGLVCGLVDRRILAAGNQKNRESNLSE